MSKLLMGKGTSIIEGIGKQTDHEEGTHHQFPPLLNVLITGHAKVCPTEGIFGLLEPILNPGSQAITVANFAQSNRRRMDHDI
jgi:hypothetical protein